MDTEMLRVLPDPYFFTTDDEYSYVANDQVYDASTREPGDLVGDIRVIREIYSLRQDWAWNDGGAGWATWGGGWNGGRYVIDPFGGDKWVPNATCIEARNPETDGCLIKWQHCFNPGDHETLWRCRAYLWPAQLNSEEIEIAMPADFLDSLLVWEVQSSIDRGSYGRNDYSAAAAADALKEFKTKYATPMIWTRPLSSPALNA